MFEPVRQHWAGRPVPSCDGFAGFRPLGAVAPAPFDEPSRIDEYARGHADGVAAATEAMQAQAAALQALRQEIAEGLRLPAGSIEAMLSAAAVRIADALGVAAQDGACAVEVGALASAIAAECTPVAVHVSPDHAAALDDTHIGVPIVADAAVAPGAVRVRIDGGWIEDGVPVRLARFKAALLGGGVA